MNDSPTQPTPAPPAPTTASLPRVPGYEILGEIARGGMGIVYRARQAGLDRVVALKVMIAGEHASAEALERFLREARSAARVDHPNVVQVYDSGREGALHFFTMRLVQGVPLSRFIGHEFFPVRRALTIARTVLLALDAAHAQGVIHRDVKPGNILVDGSGEPHVSDFGLAKDLHAEGLTMPGAAMGTPAYAPPEQVAGEMDRVGPWSDVYSLGVTLYEMLTCRVPFTGDSVFQVLQSILSTEPLPPRSFNPQIPPEAEWVVMKALEKDPQRRYRSAHAMAEDLRRVLDGEPLDIRPPSTMGRFALGLVRRAPVVRATALAVLLCVGVGAWAIVRAHRRDAGLAALLASARLAEAEAETAPDAASRKAALIRARDALIGARDLDDQQAGPASAVEPALARAEARLADLLTAEARGREAAARAAADAEASLRKAELVAAVFGRWSRLRVDLRAIEAIRYDPHIDDQETLDRTADPLRRVHAFLADTPGDATSRAVALALAGWATRLSGREDEGRAMLEEARSLDPDVPYGAILEALTLFASYVEKQPLPEVRTVRGGISIGEATGESPALAELRARMEALLEVARNARVWGEEGTGDLAAAIGGVRAWQEGRYDEAERAFSAALVSPDLAAFGTGLLLARGKVRYLRRDFAGAREDLTAVLEVRPGAPDATSSLATTLLAEALTAASHGESPVQLLEAASSRFEEVLALFPDALDANNGLALVAQERAAIEGARGGDPRPWWDRAEGCFSRLIARNPKEILAWNNRAWLYRRRAEWEAAHGADPSTTIAKSIADLDETIRLSPGVAMFHMNRARVLRAQGEWFLSRGQDARSCFQRAIEDCDEAISLEPEEPRHRVGRSAVLVCLAMAHEARGEREEAVKAYETAIEASPEPEAIRDRIRRLQGGK